MVYTVRKKVALSLFLMLIFIIQHAGKRASVKFAPFSSKGFISPKSNAINAKKHDIILPFMLYCVSVKNIRRLLRQMSDYFSVCRHALMPLNAAPCQGLPFYFQSKILVGDYYAQ